MNTNRTHDQPGSAPAVTTVAGYLLTRLAEAGVASVFGVPGDDNLGLLDAITARPNLAWIGTATEQGAGYAADSYARLRGLGALVTTFGAGELSALNAIAGAYAESVPVVHIVGTPALTARKPGATVHHVLPGTGFDHFAGMAAGVTAAQADLRPDSAPAEIDRVLSTALRTSRPVYLGLPTDVADTAVPAPAKRLTAIVRGGQVRTDLTGLRATSAARPAGTGPTARRAVTQARLWARVQEFLQPRDLPIADQGTAFCGAAELALPDEAHLAGQTLWASPGWGLPAVLGASLAAPDRRVILITGDAAMQQTAPELGTLLAQGLVPVIIVLNNGGYAVWDWTALPGALAPSVATVTLRVRTGDELARALKEANDHAAMGRPVMIEVILGADDTPPMHRVLPRVLAHR